MVIFLALALAVASPAAATLLTDVSLGDSGGRLALQGPVRYRAFSLTSPDRYVVDLFDTSIGISERSWPGAGKVTRLRAAPWENGATRVVFDLARPVRAKAREAGGALVVEFSERAPVPEPAAAEPDAAPVDFRDAVAPMLLPPPSLRPAPSLNAPAAILAIEAAPDRVVLRLDRPAAADIFLAHKPPRLVIDLAGARLATRAPGPVASGGIVAGVRAGAFKPGMTRVVLDLDRAAPYSIERDGSTVAVNFEPLLPSPSEPSRTREWRGWIVDAAGQPLSGVFLVRFSLPDGGSGERWSEALYVDARGGRFAAVLGRRKRLPDDALAPGSPLDAAPPAGLSWRVIPR
ncbi:MAG: AMIN domain-containing protein [Elusimicrobia bacterium]|nr:AMIN domain-containing protein [Elusimicrobiota bacterium]